ncbi:MAG: choice-of-anchor D domain-containing protein, partial [Planctomycetes bacterium]|nr:choice-of-anchor D domain-containing protein [Planctomycetota bacterium]
TDEDPYNFNISATVAVTNIIINEVDADNSGYDYLEFIELYDGGVGNTPLDGLVVVAFNGSNNSSYSLYFWNPLSGIDLDGYSTDANGYFVIGNNGVPGRDLVFNDNRLQNGADAVALYIGDDTDFPNNTAATTTNLLDAIVYDTNDGDDGGLLVLLNPGQPQVNESGGPSGASNQRCSNGSGGQRNTDTYIQGGPTPDAANDCPSEIDIFQGTVPIADNTDSYDFGTTTVGSPLDVVFIVQNNGGANLTLIEPITVPAGFDVQESFNSTDVAPGNTTTFTIRLLAITPGNFSGELSFGNNDNDENPYNFTISGTVFGFDFGDAPDPTYPTLFPTGASHVLSSGLWMGPQVDADSDGQQSTNADGDDSDGIDDEDGVTLPASLIPGAQNNITIDVSANGGYLNAWIDYNANGNWTDSGEQVYTDLSLNAGSNPLSFNVPAGAACGQTIARFRLSTQTGLTPQGSAPDGEVEDYIITISDVESPQITDCPQAQTTAMDEGVCGAIVTWTAPGAIDNCDAEVTPVQTQGPVSGSLFPAGETTIEYTAT